MTQETGRLAEDVKIKEVEFNGEKRKAVNNCIAVKRNGNITTFIRFSAWGAAAEFLEKYFKKGDPITVSGELRNADYEKNGAKLQTVYLLAEKIAFVPQNKKKNETAE